MYMYTELPCIYGGLCFCTKVETSIYANKLFASVEFLCIYASLFYMFL